LTEEEDVAPLLEPEVADVDMADERRVGKSSTSANLSTFRESNKAFRRLSKTLFSALLL
jgi:hypothetical protein